MFIKALTILVLVAAILGGSGYFIYELYYKEKKLDVVEQTAAPTPTPEPTPDPAIVAFDALNPLLAQDTPAARDAILNYLEIHPESPRLSDARAALGRINLALFRDPVATPQNTIYTVKKGDSLARIASQLKSNAELIYWANELSSINLQIGQELLVPVTDTFLVIDRDKSTVSVFNHGLFFKEYPTLSIKLVGAAASGEFQAKVADRIATKGETRVAFGSKDYPDAERLILLSSGGIALRTPPVPAPPAPPAPEVVEGTPPPVATPAQPTTPSGIILSPESFSEIFVLVKSGTPVTIK